MTTIPQHKEQVKRLSVVLPTDISDEICGQTTPAKAMLLILTAEDVLEKIEGFPDVNLSATTTQWLRSINILEQLQLIENLALMLMSEVKK
jgi:hypothetical protein